MKSLRKLFKKVTVCLCAVGILVSASVVNFVGQNVPVLSDFSISASAASTVINQNDSQWATSANNFNGTLKATGCGIFSFANAINYAKGSNVVNPTTVAAWANQEASPKALNLVAGEGLRRDNMYPAIQTKFGSTYGFTVGSKTYGSITNATLKTHLTSGSGKVAVAHVYNHFIAIVGYNASSNQYHVLESAVSSSRTLTANDSWVAPSTLSTGNTNVDWFVLLTVNVASYYPIYTGTSTSIVTALDFIGVDSSYAHRSAIAAANSISGYTGTAAQNTTMLNLLKAGTLKKSS